MQKVGRLELTWVGKYEEDRFEPRILIEDKEKSYAMPQVTICLSTGIICWR